MGLAKDATLLTKRFRAFEDLGAGHMPKSDRVLFADDFSDGLLHGWRPVHFGGDRPFSPLSVETDYPMPGLFMATGSTPYRSNAWANTVSTYKGLSGRLPTSGIVSFSGEFAIQSGGPGAGAWDSWTVEMDIQNWTDTLRATPVWKCANPGDGTSPRWQIIDDTQTFHSIGSPTGLVNPVDSALSGVSATKSIVGGENEAKWDINYVRVSFDLGDMFALKAAPTTAQYYEININGFRFDLRAEGAGRASRSPQAGSLLASFKGGLNFGLSLYRSTAAGAIYPARLIAGALVGTYHESGWLA